MQKKRAVGTFFHNSKAGNGFSLKKQETLIHDIKINFSQLLIEICENFENRGIFFIIDDINGLSDNIEFTNWYKSLFETIQFNEYYIPAAFALISYPEEFDNLCSLMNPFQEYLNLLNLIILKSFKYAYKFLQVN